jgi:hypothetical protein
VIYGTKTGLSKKVSHPFLSKLAKLVFITVSYPLSKCLWNTLDKSWNARPSGSVAI